MNEMHKSLADFIVKFAKKIVNLYPSGCADQEDYIQIGYLTLAEIKQTNPQTDNFEAYALVSICRAMRNAAIDSFCIVSAPRELKRKIRSISRLMLDGKTDAEICDQLDIPNNSIGHLKSLVNTQSIHNVFGEQEQCVDQFSAFDDMLSSGILTDQDKDVICDQLCENKVAIGKTRRRRWEKYRKMRHRLTRSGYGI